MILAVLFAFLLNHALAQDPNCNFYQTVQPGQLYNISSPGYIRNYPRQVQCRWTGTCPAGYNCRIDCPDVDIPYTVNCTMDRLLVSRTGDPQLNSAQVYCDRGSLSVVSTGQTLTIGLISSYYSPGGRFTCNLSAQPAVPASTCQCGERQMNRIVGGTDTEIGEFRMMAGLVNSVYRQVTCGGVVISDRYIATAAHCLSDSTTDNTFVLLGARNVQTGDSPGTQGYRINRFIPHPQFNPNTYDYDIALIEVVQPIAFNQYVGPVCLPFKFVNTNFTGQPVTITGWGTLSPGGQVSNVLQKVNVSIISQPACLAAGVAATRRQVCTYAYRKDSCQFDSGGPLLYSDPSTGRLFWLGVVSYGNNFCASSTPSVNTRVTEMLNWITATTRVNYCVK